MKEKRQELWGILKEISDCKTKRFGSACQKELNVLFVRENIVRAEIHLLRIDENERMKKVKASIDPKILNRFIYVDDCNYGLTNKEVTKALGLSYNDRMIALDALKDLGVDYRSVGTVKKGRKWRWAVQIKEEETAEAGDKEEKT